MHLTLKAILARFDGDVTAAFHYCIEMAGNPRLFEEYTALAEQLTKE